MLTVSPPLKDGKMTHPRLQSILQTYHFKIKHLCDFTPVSLSASQMGQTGKSLVWSEPEWSSIIHLDNHSPSSIQAGGGELERPEEILTNTEEGRRER